MNTEQLKLMSIRAQHLGRAVRELEKAAEIAFQSSDLRACDKIREHRRSIVIELKLANNEVRKVDLF